MELQENIKYDIPQDIIDKANRKYPEPDRGDFHTDTEYEYALVTHNGNKQREAYILGALDERFS